MATIKMSVLIAVGIMLVGLVVFQIFPVQLLEIFDASENMLGIGVPALRIISLSFIFAGYIIIIISVFQALGESELTVRWSSVIRQLFVILPVAYLFARVFGLSRVWWALIAEIVAVTVTTLMFRRIIRLKIKPLEEPR